MQARHEARINQLVEENRTLVKQLHDCADAAQLMRQLEERAELAEAKLARATKFIDDMDATDYVAASESGTWEVGNLSDDFLRAVNGVDDAG